MNVIDRVKELLAGAESRTQSRRIYSRKCLADLSIPLAQALVESQEALKAMANCDNESCREFGCMCGDDALRMDGLKEAMK